MPNTHQTLQDIADILSFESDKTLLKARLESDSMDWDHLVRVGSSHLVLPAIYCRLKAKKLLHVLPQELESYLKEITALNRERNQQLLAEAQQISQWFQEAHLDHVFLKGTAMLASGCYEDIGERMVGDIDLIVSKKDLKKSFALLERNSYKGQEQILGNEFYPNQKHLPRLISSSFIGAVEIHQQILRKKNNLILSDGILQTKTTSQNLYIPSSQYLVKHCVLNHQINDYGYLNDTLSLKSVYDLVSITKNKKSNFLNSFNDKYFSKFRALHGQYFKSFKNKSLFNAIQIFNYQLKLRYRNFNVLIFIVNNFYIVTDELFKRLIFLFKSKLYRKAIFKNKSKLMAHLKTKF